MTRPFAHPVYQPGAGIIVIQVPDVALCTGGTTHGLALSKRNYAAHIMAAIQQVNTGPPLAMEYREINEVVCSHCLQPWKVDAGYCHWCHQPLEGKGL